VFEGLILKFTGNGRNSNSKMFWWRIECVIYSCIRRTISKKKYVGVGASRIRELFKLAIDNKAAVLFLLDEIDAWS
jgi:AAA+ superfamily predicted ATPase